MTDLCHYCGIELGDEHPRTIDHIVPRSLGGVDEWFNKTPACSPCNIAKSNIWPTCSCDRCRRARRFHLTRYGIHEFSLRS